MRRLKLLWSVLWIGFAGSANACAWDRDTLAAEVKGLPNVVQIITGRFERNPPLFYEMRLKRVAEQMRTEPQNLELYDDAGVACDRLNRDDEAIVWMNKKRQQLARLLRARPEVKEHWYRYYANIGTFRAHRWLRSGADRKRIAEMKQARNEIAKAIEINPNAHLGREKVQLVVMDWIRGDSTDSIAVPLSKYLKENWDSDKEGAEDKENQRKGLIGLIALGNAWESVDIFEALAAALGYRGSLVMLAKLRASELIDRGRSSLESPLKGEELKQHLRLDEVSSLRCRKQQVRDGFHILRAEAEEWTKKRQDYMLARLQAGRHPDTDSAFWNDWRDSGPPSVEPSRLSEAQVWLCSPEGMIAGALFILMAGPVLLVAGVRRLLRRRRFRLTTSKG